ncbi:hypothetical protein N7470_006342 [Penicillium chermesinum]|nr:hypothetical protein N7470_006342 [Penicillium chermesinum]
MSLQKLDAELKEWKEGLPTAFSFTPLTTGSTRPEANALQLHLVYNQAMCTLHSSIIPLFSFYPQEKNYGFFKSVSAQTALYHARQISEMFIQAKMWSRNHATGFMGYAAYCSMAVQMPFLWCEKDHIQQNAHSNIIVNLDRMHAIGRHWKLVAILVEYVPALYKYHKELRYSLRDEPRTLDEVDLDRHQGKRVKVRTSILGYNRIIGCVSRQPSLRETGKLSLDFDDDQVSSNDSGQAAAGAEVLAEQAGLGAFETPHASYMESLDIHELFSDSGIMASSDEYFDLLSQLGGSVFDTGQEFLPDTMDFPSIF